MPVYGYSDLPLLNASQQLTQARCAAIEVTGDLLHGCNAVLQSCEPVPCDNREPIDEGGTDTDTDTDGDDDEDGDEDEDVDIEIETPLAP